MSNICMNAVDVKIVTYYNLDGSYIHFPDNKLNEATYHNVDIMISQKKRNIGGYTFLVDIVKIGTEPPIECELVRHHKDANGTLILGICQDWG